MEMGDSILECHYSEAGSTNVCEKGIERREESWYQSKDERVQLLLLEDATSMAS